MLSPLPCTQLIGLSLLVLCFSMYWATARKYGDKSSPCQALNKLAWNPFVQHHQHLDWAVFLSRATELCEFHRKNQYYKCPTFHSYMQKRTVICASENQSARARVLSPMEQPMSRTADTPSPPECIMWCSAIACQMILISTKGPLTSRYLNIWGIWTRPTTYKL